MVKVSNRVIAIVLVFEYHVLWLIYSNVLQSIGSFEEKECSYQFINKCNMPSVDKLVVWLGDQSSFVWVYSLI